MIGDPTVTSTTGAVYNPPPVTNGGSSNIVLHQPATSAAAAAVPIQPVMVSGQADQQLPRGGGGGGNGSNILSRLNFVDEVEESVVNVMLHLNFKKIYAVHMVTALREVIRANCLGCQLNLPSQLDHTCLTETVLTHMNTYWADALEQLDHEGVVFEFYTWCQAEGLSTENFCTAEAFYDAGGLWTQDIKGMAATFYRANNVF